ncbi:MAG: cbb3-type cytochrome c oxidase subunit I [Burkholderiaceae bacterium]|nr:cbb3-type cytochrome c oxidase subunit I [Burkholderiaceae bacterium]
MKNLANWFLRLAVLYFVAGVALGLYMAASHDHTMHPVHAHLNLLGWVSLGLFGVFYTVVPEAAQTRLARAHFWLYVPAHFVMMVLLFELFRGHLAVEPFLGVAAFVVGAGVLCFAVVVWRHTGALAVTFGERLTAAQPGVGRREIA